jgi:predicted RNA-binding protein with PUA-like domain
MAFWLIKTEPSAWSWQDQIEKKVTSWDGVRNYQAANNLKAMKIGDQCFFYHSVKERQIVGIVEVIKTYHSDPSDPTGRFGMVDVKTVRPLLKPVSLDTIKSHPTLQHLALVRQSRLSVMPIDNQSWSTILALSGDKL